MASKNVELVRDGMRLLLNGVLLDDDVRSFIEHLLLTLEGEE